MSVTIVEVNSKRSLKTFVRIPFSIYAKNDYWVPPLIRDELDTFNKQTNPSYKNAESRLFIAYRNDNPAGCIAAILSHAANRKYKLKNLRFGWFDTIEDYAVAEALFASVEEWARELGMKTITGPHGFTGFDKEGMLIEGFDQLPTIAVYYNHPYYREFIERYGFRKEVDHVEYKTRGPYETGIPERLLRIAEKVRQKSRLRVLEFKTKKAVMARAEELFALLNEAYANIYGFISLGPEQIDYYIKKYITFMDKDLLKVVVNEDDEMVGFMLAMPSLSRAFQKARGRLFPAGWWHILRALKDNEILDFYLVGVKSNYRGRGVDLLMRVELAKAAMRRGFIYAESNPELETNTQVQAQWKYFNPEQHKRRRIYKKEL